MYYRSDWPEVGLSAAVNERTLERLDASAGSRQDWVHESRAGDTLIRWIGAKDRFESGLYDFPIWNLHLELDNAGGDILHAACCGLLKETINEEIKRFVDAPPWGPSYVFSRMLRTEPLHEALLENGFKEIENRRLYKTQIRNLAPGASSSLDSNLHFMSLAETDSERRAHFRRQIFEICDERFGREGYSRHFTDPFLLGRLTGHAYIKAAMRLNFERLSPDCFLLAVDNESLRVCGFSVVGKKQGPTPNLYTQLLSAVRGECQGRDIYSSFTRLLMRMLSPDATLLNITHAANHGMQIAYQRSGRVHLADTVVARRVFGAGEQ